MSTPMELPALLGLDTFDLDEHPHIEVDASICATCPTQDCVAACPAQLYRRDLDGLVVFDHAGCLECGTCAVVCTHGGVVAWRWPRAGHGVSYRFG